MPYKTKAELEKERERIEEIKDFIANSYVENPYRRKLENALKLESSAWGNMLIHVDLMCGKAWEKGYTFWLLGEHTDEFKEEKPQ